MSLTLLPVELLLLVITFLPTRDIVVLGHTCRHLRAIAEDERAKRQDIDRLLSRYVDHPEQLRRLMRDTGGFIIGEFARAFFTGDDPPKRLDLLFPPQDSLDIKHGVLSWTSFFRNSGMIQSPLQAVNSVGYLHWTREVGVFLYVP
jgi:hypothetical protein